MIRDKKANPQMRKSVVTLHRQKAMGDWPGNRTAPTTEGAHPQSPDPGSSVGSVGRRLSRCQGEGWAFQIRRHHTKAQKDPRTNTKEEQTA